MTRSVKTASLIAVAAVVIFLCIDFAGELLFTTRTPFNIVLQPLEGPALQVGMVEVKKGLFISGGHGWSLGSTRTSYKLAFTSDGQRLDWEGPGVPIILQREGPSFFLATFDRETDFHHIDFVCYRWDGGWSLIPTHEFPKKLTAFNNLIKLGTGSSSSNPKEFASSLLARFWYCVDQRVPEWKVQGSDLTEDFVESYRRKMK